jgi:hypothetical protein
MRGQAKGWSSERPLGRQSILFAAAGSFANRIAGCISPVVIFARDRFLKSKTDIFFLTIDVGVTLVQHRTLKCVHFFLDFVFH